MAFLVFILSFVLLAAGVAGGYLSLDLLPTPAGTLYALAGAVSVVGAIIVLVLGLLIMRVGRLTTVVRQQAVAAAIPSSAPFALAEEPAEPGPEVEHVEPFESFEPIEAEAVEAERIEGEAVEIEALPESGPAPEAEEAPAEEAESPPAAEETEDGTAESEEPVNENRAGRLPTLGEIERAIETPERAPTLIGRYTSGGANYMIFSDGSIEAETDDGAYKFASMSEFKKFLLERNAAKP